MSEDSGKPTQATQEVDLDNIEVEVLIICKNPNQLNQAGSFLTRRGWPTKVIFDLQEAIEYLAEKKPDFVLVSFSHTSSRILKLPDLITQTFNLDCIGFVEGGDAASGAKLANSRVRYKINGQASGPSIHRTIRKILAERFNIKTDEKSSSSEREKSDKDSSSIVKVKGSGNTAAGGPGVIMQKGSANATLGKGAQMVKGQASGPGSGEDGSNSMVTSGTGGDGGGYGYGGGSATGEELSASVSGSESEMVGVESESETGGAKKPRGPRKSLKDLAGSSGSDESGASDKGASGAKGSGKKIDINQLTKSLLGDETEGADGFASDASTSSSSSSSSSGGGRNGMSLAEAQAAQQAALAAQAAAGAGAAGSAVSGESSSGPSSSASSSSAGNKIPLMEYDPIQSADEKKRSEYEAGKKSAIERKMESADLKNASQGSVPSLEEERKKQQEKAAKEKADAERAAKDPVFAAQSLMQKAVEAAMGRYCKTPPGVELLRLEEITYVGVFPIESETMPGYLVVVWQAPDLSSREAFLRDCETEIRTAFNSMNVAGKISTGFWTQLPAVEFVAWADSKANFHFMTAHQKREVGVAFFKTSGPLPKAKASAGGMYSLNVKDMSTDVAVNFKAYLYLKQNEKHFMYLRNGRKLQPEQKERLLKNQVNEVFMKSVDLENLRQYLAAGYLSGLIIEFSTPIAVASQPTRKSS